MKNSQLDNDFLTSTLFDLLHIHSPSGYTDQIVHYVGEMLAHLEIEFNVTRRGAIRATLPGKQKTLDRAVTVHLDTLGAMVSRLEQNGRLGIAPIGTWSSRFAEGARVTIFSEKGPIRGTVLPKKASGHIFHKEIDTQPTRWDRVEIRVDRRCRTASCLSGIGLNIGDFVAFDAVPEMTSAGFINAKHLDDKGGVAVLLAVAKYIRDAAMELPVDCHLIFTIFEEVGSGASAVVHGDVAEMVTIDHAPVGPGQNASEYGVTIAMMDQTGPFDYHLSRKLIEICEKSGIAYARDVFKHYRSDSASALAAGNDTRTALLGFGVDASHGYERCHLSSLVTTAGLTALYIQSPPTFSRDKDEMASLEGFPHQPDRDVIQIKT